MDAKQARAGVNKVKAKAKDVKDAKARKRKLAAKTARAKGRSEASGYLPGLRKEIKEAVAAGKSEATFALTSYAISSGDKDDYYTSVLLFLEKKMKDGGYIVERSSINRHHHITEQDKDGYYDDCDTYFTINPIIKVKW